MKILMRTHKEEQWQLVQSAAYANETELQKLLVEQPSLISVNEVREGAGTLVAAVREFPLDIGSIDLVGFTADGDIAVVECKLAANEEIKRKVIGQVMEYGANLWGMSYEELDQKILLRANKNLADFVREVVEDPDWEQETFRGNVIHALKTGSFILIIVVDEINENLGRIIRFINEASKPSFSLAALEMRRFQRGQVEILVPHLFGTVGADKLISDTTRTRWTEQRFFDVAKSALAPDIVQVIRDVYDWSKLKAWRVWFGNGTVTGSYTFHYQRNGKSVSMFSVYTTGVMTVNYGWLSLQVDPPMIQKFHEELTAIPGFHEIPAEFNKWPSVRIEDVFLNRPDSLSRFRIVVETFGNLMLH